jgi:hypothetical protein
MSSLVPTPHRVVEVCDYLIPRTQPDTHVWTTLQICKDAASLGQNFVIDVQTVDALDDDDWRASMYAMAEANCFRLPFECAKRFARSMRQRTRFSSTPC